MKKAALLVGILVLALVGVGMTQTQMGKADAPRGGDGPGFGPGRCMMGGGAGWGMHQGMRMGMRGGMHEGMGIQMILRHADDLKLTDQQKDKLQGMITTFQTESIDARANLEKAQVTLRDAMRRDAAESEVLSDIDQVAKLRGEMQKMQYRHHEQAKGVLTADQVKQLKDLRQNWGKRMFQNWQKDNDNNGSGRPGRQGRRG